VAESQAVKQVGDKVFILRDGIWTDTIYEGQDTTKVGFASDDYFQLLSAHPEWARYFSVGEKVIVVLDNVAYEVTEEAQPPIDVPSSVRPGPVDLPAPWNIVAKLIEWIRNLLGF